MKNTFHSVMTLALFTGLAAVASTSAKADIRVGDKVAATFVRDEAFTAEIEQVEIENVPAMKDKESIVIVLKSAEQGTDTISFSGPHLETGRVLATLLGHKIQLTKSQNQYVRSETWPIFFKVMR